MKTVHGRGNTHGRCSSITVVKRNGVAATKQLPHAPCGVCIMPHAAQPSQRTCCSCCGVAGPDGPPGPAFIMTFRPNSGMLPKLRVLHGSSCGIPIAFSRLFGPVVDSLSACAPLDTCVHDCAARFLKLRPANTHCDAFEAGARLQEVQWKLDLGAAVTQSLLSTSYRLATIFLLACPHECLVVLAVMAKRRIWQTAAAGSHIQALAKTRNKQNSIKGASAGTGQGPAPGAARCSPCP